MVSLQIKLTEDRLTGEKIYNFFSILSAWEVTEKK